MSHPPISQVTLTSSFAPPLFHLTIVDMVELFGEFRADYPVFQQVQRALPMTFQPFHQQFEIGGSGMPRLAFVGSDVSRQIFFQEDRVSYQWQRSASYHDEPSYPGFDHVLEQFVAASGKLREWVKKRYDFELQPAVGEIAYSNAFLVDAPDGTKRSVQDFLNVALPSDQESVLSSQLSWTERAGPGLSGYLTVTVNTPAQLPDGTGVVLVQTAVSFDPGGDWSLLRDRMQAAHASLGSVFDRLVKPEFRAI